jgi:hypothetical protein
LDPGPDDVEGAKDEILGADTDLKSDLVNRSSEQVAGSNALEPRWDCWGS